MISGAGGKGKNWNVGDILGRSKEGFKPLNTDEGEGMLDDDSDSEVKYNIMTQKISLELVLQSPRLPLWYDFSVLV